MNRDADQEAAPDGDCIEQDVVHLADTPGHEPLDPFVRDAQRQPRACGERHTGHVGTSTPRPIEQVGHETVFDKVKRLDEVDLRLSSTDRARVPVSYTHLT